MLHAQSAAADPAILDRPDSLIRFDAPHSADTGNRTPYPDPQFAGPFESQNQHPLELMHRFFLPSTPAIIQPGTFSISVEGAWANTVNRRKGSYLFDAEVRTLRPQFRIGLTRKLELSLDQPVIWRGGGFTDSWIEDWHTTFGLPQGPRRFVPRDEFVLEGHLRDGKTYRETRAGTGLGDAQLATKWKILEEQDTVLSLVTAASLPTGRESFGQDATDLTGGALGSVRLTPSLTFFLGGGYTYLLDPWQDELQFMRQQLRGFTGMSYLFFDRWSLYAGINGGGALLKNVERFPDYQLYFDAGLRRMLSRATVASLLVRENPAPSQATTDISVHFNLMVHLP